MIFTNLECTWFQATRRAPGTVLFTFLVAAAKYREKAITEGGRVYSGSQLEGYSPPWWGRHGSRNRTQATTNGCAHLPFLPLSPFLSSLGTRLALRGAFLKVKPFRSTLITSQRCSSCGSKFIQSDNEDN